MVSKLGLFLLFLLLAWQCQASDMQKSGVYVKKIIEYSAKEGGNTEENIFDKNLLVHWRKLLKKKCFEVPGIDAELTMHQDSNAHSIRVYNQTMTRVGLKVRASYIVFGNKIDKDFYLSIESGRLKIYDVCDHPSELDDRCYRHTIEQMKCAD